MENRFGDPGIADGESAVYTLRLGTDPSIAQVSSIIEHDGDAYVSRLTAGSGDSFNMKVEQRFLRSSGALVAESYRAASYFEDQVVSREEGYFLGTSHAQLGGKIAPFPNGLMPLLGGLTLLRGLDFRRGARSKYDLWLAFSICWPVEVIVEKQISITVAVGRMDTWQVRIRPSFSHINGLLDKIVAGLLPPFIGHFEVAAPHRLVRFSFPSGPLPWHPRGLIELAD